MPAGIEPATFQFVVRHRNHCATAVPITTLYCSFFHKAWVKTNQNKAMWHLCIVFQKFHIVGSEQCYFHYEWGNYLSVLLWHEYQHTFSVNLLFGDLTRKTHAFLPKITDRYIKPTIPSWILTASILTNLDYSTSSEWRLHDVLWNQFTQNVRQHDLFILE